MTGLTVLNTRARDQAAELSRLLRNAGCVAIEAPAIDIKQAWDPLELERVRKGLTIDTYAWVVLPSPNAGRELVAEVRQSHARLVCGASTATTLGLDRDALALDPFSAAAALDAMRPLVSAGERVLLPRAAEGRDELVDGLRKLGALVDAPVAYRTVAVEAAANRVRQGGIDVVTLCSPSAARSVGPAVAPGTIVVCLGETTASAARALGLRVNAVAVRTSMSALVEAVQSQVGARV